MAEDGGGEDGLIGTENCPKYGLNCLLGLWIAQRGTGGGYELQGGREEALGRNTLTGNTAKEYFKQKVRRRNNWYQWT